MTRRNTSLFFRKLCLIASILFFIGAWQFTYAQTIFAVIGDFGYNGTNEGDVASMVAGWNPDHVITVGDNIYETRTTDYSTAVGDYYHQYMYPVDPNYSSDTQTTNRFWPVVGNHDWAVGSNLSPYLSYFQMVNNKRYYNFTLSDIEFFAIDSDTHEPDGTSSTSNQGVWLQQKLTNSTARWKIVLFHHPPYYSGGSNSYMEWPFKSWGADAVINGHIHFYERLMVNNLVYFVNGLGGASKKSFPNSESSYSQAHYDSDYGAMKITESINNNTSTLKFEFFSLDNVLAEDTYTIDQLLPVELISFSAKLNGNSSVRLAWATATEVNNYGFDIERSNPPFSPLPGGEAKGWVNIGFVSGSGNSNSPKYYTFEDNPIGGTSFSYRLKQIDVGGSYKYYDAVSVSLSALSSAKLLQNNPNPFNPSTAIKFYIPNVANVTIKIYDLLGREVKTLLDDQTAGGYHVVYWSGEDSRGRDVSSGIYFYMLRTENFVETKKMNLLK